MKLSDRLEAEASLSRVVEIGSGYTISADRHDEQTQALLREAAALAKRYEDAPVRMVGESTSYSASVAGTGIKNGQRVRIVLDKEG